MKQVENFKYKINVTPIFLLVFFLFGIILSAQETKSTYYIDGHFFGAKIFKHSDDVGQLYGFPNGQFFALNKRTFGDKIGKDFNFPEFGFSVSRVDFNNDKLGQNIAIGFHYNFFFWKRQLMLRVSQGLAYNNNPYNKENNNKNVAFGSNLLSNTHMMFLYQKPNLIDNLGFQAGFLLNHYSNGGYQEPNTGINMWGIIAGLNYGFGEKREMNYKEEQQQKYSEPIRYNVALRTGFSQPNFVGFGSFPFYHFGIYADKRWHRKSAIQFGTDIFFTTHLKELIKFYSVAYVNSRGYTDPNTDYKRIGIFAGHELFLGQVSIETQLGFYVYKPFKYDKDYYERIGIKYYFTDKIFAGVGLKAHGTSAETSDLTIGYRF